MEILIVFGLVCTLLVGMGTYIWVKEATWLLANFPKDPMQIRDRKGLARSAGIYSYVIAVTMAVSGYGLHKFAGTKYELVPVAISIPVTSILTIIFIVNGQRYLVQNGGRKI
ncbi:DUF3784 domain-containing protein [Dyadobacter sp.]|uniref:DUF3784 domain-containing protein n=1 Tax=Dyadobacter sp. TaxID=1914288 RepID=UPI003F72A1B8